LSIETEGLLGALLSVAKELSTGEFESVVELSPNCLLLFLPQHFDEVSVFREQECDSPSVI